MYFAIRFIVFLLTGKMGEVLPKYILFLQKMILNKATDPFGTEIDKFNICQKQV